MRWSAVAVLAILLHRHVADGVTDTKRHSGEKRQTALMSLAAVNVRHVPLKGVTRPTDANLLKEMLLLVTARRIHSHRGLVRNVAKMAIGSQMRRIVRRATRLELLVGVLRRQKSAVSLGQAVKPTRNNANPALWPTATNSATTATMMSV